MNREQPNILLILTDQQRFDSLSCTGCGVIDTPNLDRLAAEGTLFETCVCSSPVCTPSRASLWTGKDVPSHGVSRLYDDLADRETLFPELLRRGGYRTGLFGKLHVSSLHKEAKERHPHDGFDVYEWCNEAPLYMESPLHGYSRWLAAKDPALREKLMREGRNLKHIPAPLHFTRWASEKTCEFIETTPAGQPWFACLSVFDPHNPYDCGPREYYDAVEESRIPDPVPPVREPLSVHAREARSGYMGDIGRLSAAELRAMRRGYHSTLKFLDDELGRVFRFLKESGRYDDTLIIFTSDHGDMLGDHGLLVKGNFFFDACVNVPLLMRLPGRFSGGERIAAPVRNFDVAPTILAAAGFTPEQLTEWMPEARDLALRNFRETVICRYRNTGISCRNGYWRDPEMHGTMIRDRRWKLAYYPVTGEGELYDMANDPREEHNLWTEERFAAEKRRLLKEMELQVSSGEFLHQPPGGETLPPGGFRIDNRQGAAKPPAAIAG